MLGVPPCTRIVRDSLSFVPSSLTPHTVPSLEGFSTCRIIMILDGRMTGSSFETILRNTLMTHPKVELIRAEAITFSMVWRLSGYDDVLDHC